MSASPGFFSRIGRLFSSNGKSENGSSLMDDSHDYQTTSNGDTNGHSNGNGSHSVITHDAGVLLHTGDASRSTFLRPWARRDAAINNLQDGFVALTDLMGSVKDSLDRQSARQDELMEVLSTLPEALRSIPETSAMQTQTLKAIAEQVQQQNAQQARLGEILERVTETGGNQKQILEAMNQRVENLSDQDRNIADHLSTVGTALQGVGRNAQTSTMVLEQMRDNINSREGEMQRLLQKQATRYTTMLAIAIFLSIGALVAVSVIGYLMLNRGH